MARRSFAVLLAFCAVLVAVVLPAAAQTQYPPGLRVGLTAPATMTPATRFPGFEDADRKAAITILDMPLAAMEGLERSAFAQSQTEVQNLKREAFPFETGMGVLVTGTATENGEKVHKWFLIASSATGPVRDLATLVSVQVPDKAMDVYSDKVVRDALRSVTFRPAPVQEQLAMMPFKINDLAGFRVMSVLPGGLILIDSVEDDITSYPYMIIAIGQGAPDAANRGQFAADLLAQSPLRNLRLQSSEPLRISNGAGHEIRAQAESVNGKPVKLVQWVRFGGSGFLRIVGVAPEQQWDGMFNRFRAIRDGIEPRG
ncbi:hypothetical protein DXH78_05530 [Undibacter mobilis]|uniref:Uncharacterized protein n=1 Tax=Undibacter mobilis TaxID=2292256 RepID=A0A371B969_9BRAD|nr:hypothetical protein DXH78_05530 [Undibacter mobilis]